MKKFVSAALAVVLAVSMLTACSSGGSAETQADTTASTETGAETAAETTGSSSNGDTLIMATEAGFAPYEYTEDGENVVGVDVDYEVLGSNNGMLMVTASGTAVVTD